MNEKPRFVFIEGNDGLVRDTFNMGVINVNESSYNEAKRRHAEAMERLTKEKQEKQSLRNTLKDVAELRQEVADLKATLQLILEKL